MSPLRCLRDKKTLVYETVLSLTSNVLDCAVYICHSREPLVEMFIINDDDHIYYWHCQTAHCIVVQCHKSWLEEYCNVQYIRNVVRPLSL